ncbi:MAG: hypothetical protein ACI8PT_001461 [Gammaproteobacteria bacterium]|jgi:hypothetical protein
MNERDDEISEKIHHLMLEHRDLDSAIDALSEQPLFDQLQLRRMKSRRLLLKDSVARLESMLIPDLDA